jgi:hypothetical protein
MPKQESWLRESANGITVEIIKTYDQSYAREVYQSIDDEAMKRLAAALEIDKNNAPGDIPDPNGQDYLDFLWEELSQASLEDVRQSPRLYSFFVVTETKADKVSDIYVSADWHSAEEFANRRLAI